MERELAQVVERGIAGAEVVERQADAEIIELLHRRQRAVVVFEQQPLGDFHLEPLRRKPRLGERRDHLQGEAAIPELNRRQVDGDLDAVRPSCRLAAGAVQGPFAERDDQAGLLGNRYEYRRRHRSAQRMGPAQQRLAGRHPAGAQVDQRLVIQMELLGAERFAQIELERAALLHRLLHVHGEETMAAAAAVFGRVQRHVGLLQELVGVNAVIRRHGDADRGADVHAMAVDFERFLQRARQALGEPLGVLAALRAGLQHDELVAAEARDHIARLDDGAEPERDLLEQLVADRVAERVVDGFEPVEVDQVDGKVILAFVHGREHAADPLAELRPVGEAGEFVELGEMRDALLRALALGHVFEDDDGSAARHHPARHGDGPIAVGRGMKLVEPVLPQTADQIGDDLFRALGLVIAGADAVADELRDAHADAHRRLLQMQQFQEPLVPDLQAVLRVEHAQAVRHVVEGDVEAVGLLLEAGRQRRLLARHGQRLDDDVADRERDVHHAVDEHQHHDAHRPVRPIWIGHQRERQRQRAERQLADGDERPPSIAARNPGRVTRRGRRDRHVQGGVVRPHDGQPAQQAEQRRKSPGAVFVDVFPQLGGGDLLALLVFPVKQRGGDAQYADCQDPGRIGHQPIVADAQRDRRRNDGTAGRAHDQRGDRSKQRLDQCGANLRREHRVCPEGLDNSLDQHAFCAASLDSAMVPAILQYDANGSRYRRSC